MPERIDLKAVREAKGLTVDKVFEDTKIPKRVIRALESGDFSDLFLSPVYIRGFAKTYARYLGLDPEEVVKAIFPEVREEKKERPVPKKSDYRSGQDYVGKVLRGMKEGALFLASVVFSFLLKVPKKVYITLAVVVLGMVLVLSFGHRQVSEDSDKVVVEEKGNEAVVVKEEEKEVATPQVSSEKEDRAEEGFNILVEASDDCWMRVKADGEELFRGVLRKGDVENWSAKEEISLWVGNAGALKITCDGKIYDKIGRKGQVIKDIVFSPDCSYRIRRR